MTNAKLERILKKVERRVTGVQGQWQVVRQGVSVMVMGDERNNRMRIVAPVAEEKNVDQPILIRMMETNFTSVVDARYVIFQGIVWAAFIHPLDSLPERDFISGLDQAVTLVKTTGSTYSSSELQFGAGYEEGSR